MLIVCDFDGTATRFDTLNYLCGRFAPERHDELDGKLLSGAMSLREVIASEVAAMGGDGEAIVRAAVEEVPLRRGFGEFVATARDAGHRLVIVSAGFHQLIRPMLDAAGVPADVELLANEVSWSDGGGRITWRQVEECATCSQHCKRSDVALLRRGDDELTVYVGDGFSDRCAAESADRIFARDGLAAYLEERGVHFQHFDDFHDVAGALGMRLQELPG